MTTVFRLASIPVNVSVSAKIGISTFSSNAFLPITSTLSVATISSTDPGGAAVSSTTAGVNFANVLHRVAAQSCFVESISLATGQGHFQVVVDIAVVVVSLDPVDKVNLLWDIENRARRSPGEGGAQHQAYNDEHVWNHASAPR